MKGVVSVQVKNEQDWLIFKSNVPANTAIAFIVQLAEDWATAMESNETNQTYDQLLSKLDGVDQLSAGDVAEVFLVVLQYWAHGDDLFVQLTTLERQLVRENIENKLVLLAQSAQQAGAQQLPNQGD